MGKFIMIFCMSSAIFSLVLLFIALSVKSYQVIFVLILVTLINLGIFELIRNDLKKLKVGN